MSVYYKYKLDNKDEYWYIDLSTPDVWDRSEDGGKPIKIASLQLRLINVLKYMLLVKDCNPVTMDEIIDYCLEKFDTPYTEVTLSTTFSQLRNTLCCSNMIKSIGHKSYRVDANGVFVNENDEEIDKSEVLSIIDDGSGKYSDPWLLSNLEAIANEAYLSRSYNPALKIREIIYMTRKKECAEDSEELIDSKIKYANSLQKMQRTEEAIALREEIYNQLVRLRGKDDISTLNAELMLSQSYRITNVHINKATEIQERIYELVRKKASRFTEEFRYSVMEELATTYSRLDKNKEALELKKEVFDYCERNYGKTDYKYIEAESKLAIGYNKLEMYDEALMHRQMVVKYLSKIIGKEHPDFLSAQLNIAATLNKVGRMNEALVLQKEVLKIRKNNLGDEHEDTQTIKVNISETYKEMGEYELALDFLEQVYEYRKEYDKDNRTRIRIEEKMEYLRDKINTK